MGVFHYPRINVNGLLQVNVGTANNDDYSNDTFLPDSPYAPGQPVRLADSVNVQPMRYGMSDEDWMKWAITPLEVAPPQPSALRFNKSEGTTASKQLIPGEWNFYGDMGLTMMEVKVTGITDPGSIIPASLKSSLQQGILSFNNRPGATGRSTGMIIDVNPEDSNCSQMFADFLSMEANGAFLFSGKPTKGMTRWINFQRNTNLSGPNGAAATFQMCVSLADLQGQPILQGLPATSPDGAKLKGILFRYTLYRPLQKINVFKYDPAQWIQEMTTLYGSQGLNPDYIQLQGTIAPWFEGEPESCPVGRLLVPPGKPPLPVPPNSQSNGPLFNLCTAMAAIDTKSSTLSVDFSATFPDQYSGGPAYDPLQLNNNPKWDFGAVSLKLSYNGQTVFTQSIDYQNLTANDSAGWVFDFPIDLTSEVIREYLQKGSLTIESDQYGTLLQETPYFIVSDQSGVYAEQDATQAPNNTFRNDGAGLVNISFLVYKRGNLLTAADPERLTLSFYDTTPNQQPGPLQPLATGYQSGQPISIPVSTAGNRCITAVLSTDPAPPTLYSNLNSTLAPLINIRILPYNDYTQFYLPRTNPTDPYVGNDLLTFEVIYDEVFRNYYLLYPAMSQRIPLNDPDQWNDAEMAGRLMQRISLPFWGTAEAMPRTRDLSQSRRELLTAWCLKFFQNP